MWKCQLKRVILSKVTMAQPASPAAPHPHPSDHSDQSDDEVIEVVDTTNKRFRKQNEADVEDEKVVYQYNALTPLENSYLLEHQDWLRYVKEKKKGFCLHCKPKSFVKLKKDNIIKHQSTEKHIAFCPKRSQSTLLRLKEESESRYCHSIV